MSLHDATDVLLSSPDRAATWLQLADRYMQQYNKDNQQFVLPAQHAFLLPLIEKYSHNPGAFLKYLRGMRDSFPRGSAHGMAIQAVFRRVTSRVTQQMRRERLARAMRRAEDLHGPALFTVKQAWMARLEHKWAQRRQRFLDSARAATTGKRMAREDQEELLAEFWDMIDNEIQIGERLPPWE